MGLENRNDLYRIDAEALPSLLMRLKYCIDDNWDFSLVCIAISRWIHRFFRDPLVTVITSPRLIALQKSTLPIAPVSGPPITLPQPWSQWSSFAERPGKSELMQSSLQVFGDPCHEHSVLFLGGQQQLNRRCIDSGNTAEVY